MFHLFIKKLHYPNPKTTKALGRALSMLFYTVAKYSECCHKADLADKANKVIKNLLERVKTTMANEWIVAHFTHVFGDPTPVSKKFTKDKDDINVSFEYMLLEYIARYKGIVALCEWPIALVHLT